MELSQAEKNVFGYSAKPHPITGMAIENGSGSLPEESQAYLHCRVIEHHHGKDRADEMRRKVKAHYEIAADQVIIAEPLSDKIHIIEHEDF